MFSSKELCENALEPLRAWIIQRFSPVAHGTVFTGAQTFTGSPERVTAFSGFIRNAYEWICPAV